MDINIYIGTIILLKQNLIGNVLHCELMGYRNHALYTWDHMITKFHHHETINFKDFVFIFLWIKFLTFILIFWHYETKMPLFVLSDETKVSQLWLTVVECFFFLFFLTIENRNVFHALLTWAELLSIMDGFLLLFIWVSVLYFLRKFQVFLNRGKCDFVEKVYEWVCKSYRYQTNEYIVGIPFERKHCVNGSIWFNHTNFNIFQYLGPIFMSIHDIYFTFCLSTSFGWPIFITNSIIQPGWSQSVPKPNIFKLLSPLPTP